ncbi:hypothetical protein GCM10010170_073710 [Dactylosporangium salmoneum]|uniref:DUF3592 domain-containing protein n=1 Tax=Dactylosporangium salmoneum TaxID=53361 RepID=A0ABN3H843_9ACTN
MAAVLALGLVTGFFPGSSTRVTIERCHVSAGDYTPDVVWCTAHWKTAGFTVTGQVHGVDMSPGPIWHGIGYQDNWYVSEPPDSLRHLPAVAVPGDAAVYPALVWPTRVLFGLAVAILLIGLASRARYLWHLRNAPPRESITLRKTAGPE